MSTAELNEAMRKGDLNLVKKLRSEGAEWNDKSLDDAVNGKIDLDPFTPEGMVQIMNDRIECWIFAMGDSCPYINTQAVPIVALNYLKIDWTVQFWKDFYFQNANALSKFPAANDWIQTQLGLKAVSPVFELKKVNEIRNFTIPSNFTPEVKKVNAPVKMAADPKLLSKFKAEQPKFNMDKHFHRPLYNKRPASAKSS